MAAFEVRQQNGGGPLPTPQQGTDMSIKGKILREAFDLMNQPRDFEVGDFVTWKDQTMKNASLPKDCNDFGICVRFEEPTRASDNVGSNQYCDHKDMVLGIIDEDGEYSEFMTASRRMKKFVE